MIKKVSLFLAGLSMAFMVSCTEKETPDAAGNGEMLKSFMVKVENTNYHGKIDHASGTITIGSIENTNTITDVICKTAEGVTVNPDPKSFLNNWKKEQKITVASEKNSKIYTIVFPKYSDATEPDPDVNPDQGNVLFFDDFTTDGNPDASRWVLCKKGGSDWCNEMSESYDQAYCKNGSLFVRAENIDGELKAGGIESRGKFAFTYGKVECRARINKYPNGNFPAIWLMPQKFIYSGWPHCGEIDIMEHLKQDGFIYQTIHNYYHNKLNKPGQKHTTVKVNIEDWNVYGVEWTPEYIKFNVNGTDTFTYQNMHLQNEAEMMQWPFTTGCEMYLILNMGLGGDGTWAGPVDKANLPAEMEVDWIKVTEIEK